jgi:HEAT repeat protein
LFQDRPQGWVFDAAHEALGDTRKVTGMEKTNWVAGTGFEVSYLADEMESLTYALGNAKNPSSVPVLVRMAKRTHGRRGPVAALGQIGDARGIPICLELLEQQHQAIKRKAANLSEPSKELIATLGALKARAAVPILLSYLHSKEVIAALGRIGDERAVGPLQQIVAAQGRVDPDPYTWEERFQERKNAAMIGLIRLGQDDPIPKWIALLADRTLSWSQRYETFLELGNHPDPRAVAPLLALVKSDPDVGTVNQAISVLSKFRCKAAVVGLIDCLDTVPAREIDEKAGRREYTTAMFDEDIAKTLKTLTGQHFGPDKSLWKQWWLEEGQNVDSLK